MFFLVLPFYHLEKITKLAISIKSFFFIIFFLFFYNSQGQSLTNNVVVTIDSSIITELDLKKEIEFIKFINKSEINDNTAKIKKEITENLIDRKIKQIEVENAKIDINKIEIENYFYNYLVSNKIDEEILNNFYKTHQLDNDYFKNIISIDLRWAKMIRQIYENRININLSEIDKQLKNDIKSTEVNEKLKNQLILSEKNKVLNKFSITHLERSKKKYLIKFL